LTHYLVFGNTGEFAGWGDESAVSDILRDFAGTPLIVLTPLEDGSIMEGTVARAEGEDCWAGIYYLPEAGEFEVKLFADSNSEGFFTKNFFEAMKHAKSLVR